MSNSKQNTKKSSAPKTNEKHTRSTIILFMAILLAWPWLALQIYLILNGDFANSAMPIDSRPYQGPPLTIIALMIPSLMALVTLWPVTLAAKSFLANVEKNSRLAVASGYLFMFFIASALIMIAQLISSSFWTYLGCGESCTHVYMPYKLNDLAGMIQSFVIVINILITALYILKPKASSKSGRKS